MNKSKLHSKRAARNWYRLNRSGRIKPRKTLWSYDGLIRLLKFKRWWRISRFSHHIEVVWDERFSQGTLTLKTQE